MPESWFLAVDMQLFALSPLFIYPIWRWPNKGPALTLLSILAALCYTVTMNIKWDVPLIQLPTRPYCYYKIDTANLDNIII